MIAFKATILALLLVAPRASAQKVPVQEHTLSNGLRVLLVERHDDPTIAGGWVAHVGSANERPGITRVRGHDTNSLIADPQFVAPHKFNFQLQPTSPALRRGFTPIPPFPSPSVAP